MPSSGLPAGGSRTTSSSSSNVRRHPSAASQKVASARGSAASTLRDWMRSMPGRLGSPSDADAARVGRGVGSPPDEGGPCRSRSRGAWRS